MAVTIISLLAFEESRHLTTVIHLPSENGDDESDDDDNNDDD